MRPDYYIQTIMNELLVAVVALMLSGCKTIDCIPETIVRDSIRTEYKHDSTYIYQRDSIFIKEKADTVFVNKYVTRYKDVLKIERDTVWQENKVVEVKEVRYVPTHIKVFAWIGAFFLVALLVRIALWLYKKLVLKM